MSLNRAYARQLNTLFLAHGSCALCFSERLGPLVACARAREDWGSAGGVWGYQNVYFCPSKLTPGIRLMPGVTPNLTGHNARNAPGIIGVYAINPGIHGSMLPLLVYSMYAS